MMRTISLAPWVLALAGMCRAQPQSASDFRISLSVSPFTELLFRGGVVFSDGQVSAKNPEELQRLFMKHGANEVYARIATTRTYRIGFGDHSVARGLERARMAKALGLPFNPELGLFNIYGDIRCQPPPDFGEYPELKFPGAWTSLTLDLMLTALRAYGAIAAREILETGVKVRIWDLGNEVEFGSAGVAVRPMPSGCDDTAGGAGWYKAPTAWLEAHLWPHLARMFGAVSARQTRARGSARMSVGRCGVLQSHGGWRIPRRRAGVLVLSQLLQPAAE